MSSYRGQRSGRAGRSPAAVPRRRNPAPHVSFGQEAETIPIEPNLNPATPSERTDQLRMMLSCFLHGLCLPRQLEIPDGLSPALEKALRNQTVCVSDETCPSCAVTDGQNLGHLPWDEVELKRHGWSDGHGHHWGGRQAKDEMCLKEAGLIDSVCHHANAMPIHAQRDMTSEQMRVRFVEQPRTHVVPVADMAVTRYKCQDDFTDEHVKPVIMFAEDENCRIYLMRTDRLFVYLERSAEDNVLVLGNRANMHTTNWNITRIACLA